MTIGQQGQNLNSNGRQMGNESHNIVNQFQSANKTKIKRQNTFLG